MTHAKQCQQDSLEEEEECLRQEEDRPVITTLDSVESGVQAEGNEDLETEGGQAEALGESQVEEQCPEGSEIADQMEESQAEMPGENQVEEQGTE